jgi:hypothetical protein
LSTERPEFGPQITVDGGRTWRRADIDPDPVAAVPPGTRPVDCGLVGRPSPCRIYAVDPVDGRFAPLANQPTAITIEEGWTALVDIPLGGRLWVPGLDPATGKPAVASSSDRGVTWHTHVFTDGVPAVVRDGAIATMYLPTVAAGQDGVAHVLIYRDDETVSPYRTTDGGATWRPLLGGPVAAAQDAGFVTADGAHVIQTRDVHRVSRGGGYVGVSLPGYPRELLRLAQGTSQQAPGCYVAFSLWPLYLSGDGWTWRPVDIP